MDLDILGDLNWLAVLVATIAYFALGGIWYAEGVFGKAWQRAGGIAVPEGTPGAKFYVIPFITCFIATVATAMIAVATGSTEISEGIILGLVVGIGYAATLTLLGSVFENRPEPMTWFWISALYHIVGLVIVGIIVTQWT